MRLSHSRLGTPIIVATLDFVERVKRSTWNPDALPERTIRSAQVFEFGPVTFPAYVGATAGIRSPTDWYAG